jgi:superfamily II DNA or RNA helicase
MANRMRLEKINRSTSYEEFLKNKTSNNDSTGIIIEKEKLHDKLFDFQRDIVHWALRKGRAAIFADCGLGKTLMQLEWAKHIPGKVLILAPLAVSQQTVREGIKFNIRVDYCRHSEQVSNKITITNYEMLDRFNPLMFNGIVLDESSILKSFTGKFRNHIIELFSKTQFKLACTATPAPNDYMELGNHSEFLNILKRQEMLTSFFVHDGGDTGKWRLKGHAEEEYWKWICSWAVMLRMPSDLGYKDDGFILPQLNIQSIIVDGKRTPGYLFPIEALTLSDRLIARRSSIQERANAIGGLVNNSSESWLLWCNLNSESKQLTNIIKDAEQITGSDSLERKVSIMENFINGDLRVLVTKPSIAGFGLNLQHCHNMAFVGLSDSYEQFYQAVRRCWRFGQEKEVNCYIVTANIEGAVVANIRRKEKDAIKMAINMVKHMQIYSKSNLKGEASDMNGYKTDKAKGTDWELLLGDSCELIKTIDNDSVHYSIFSPPFASLYTYTNLINDLGNSRSEEEFFEHFNFLVKELFRVIMPGRLLSFHCMNLPSTIQSDGFIGVKDFRGDLIRLFQKHGFIYHSEVVIWKDPLVQATRTKALALAHKQIVKDSAMCGQGLADYLVTMRKSGLNSEPIQHENGFTNYTGEREPPSERLKTDNPRTNKFSQRIWQRYASPVWTDIRQTETLQYRSARDQKDERHICPLQLDVIRRALELWTNPNDLVLSPFAGIGSEGYVALEMERRFIGIELKESYFREAIRNLEDITKETKLFETIDQNAVTK